MAAFGGSLRATTAQYYAAAAAAAAPAILARWKGGPGGSRNTMPSGSRMSLESTPLRAAWWQAKTLRRHFDNERKSRLAAGLPSHDHQPDTAPCGDPGKSTPDGERLFHAGAPRTTTLAGHGHRVLHCVLGLIRSWSRRHHFALKGSNFGESRSTVLHVVPAGRQPDPISGRGTGDRRLPVARSQRGLRQKGRDCTLVVEALEACSSLGRPRRGEGWEACHPTWSSDVARVRRPWLAGGPALDLSSTTSQRAGDRGAPPGCRC